MIGYRGRELEKKPESTKERYNDEKHERLIQKILRMRKDQKGDTDKESKNNK